MKQFQNFEEENIHYWTGRTDVAAMEAIVRQTLLSEKTETGMGSYRIAGGGHGSQSRSRNLESGLDKRRTDQ